MSQGPRLVITIIGGKKYVYVSCNSFSNTSLYIAKFNYYFSLLTRICEKHHFAAIRVMKAAITKIQGTVIWHVKRGTPKSWLNANSLPLKTHIFSTLLNLYQFLSFFWTYFTYDSITESPFLHLCSKVNHLNIPPQTMKYGFQHLVTMDAQNQDHIIS